MRALIALTLLIVVRSVEGAQTIEVMRDVVYAKVSTDDGAAVSLTFDAAFPKPSEHERLPAVIFIHGGGYSHGSKSQGMPVITALAEGGYFAATINYRLADEAVFPAAVYDCKAAVRYLRAHADDLAIDPDRIGLFGHSVGGEWPVSTEV